MEKKVIGITGDTKSAVISIGTTGALVTTSQRKQAKSETIDFNRLKDQTKVSIWGATNSFPQDVIEDCRPSTVVPSTLHKMMRFLISGGLVWGKVTGFDPKGNEVITPATGENYTMVRDFFRRININSYLKKATLDGFWFWNFFPTLIYNRNVQQIVNLDIHRAEECRYGWRNKTTGLIDTVYVSANWDRIPYTTSEFPEEYDVKEITAINPEFMAAEQIIAANKTELIYPQNFDSVGTKYYALAPWDSIRSGGWLQLSLEIPKFKKSLMENQITMKYHIQIEEGWWDWKYPGFSEMSPQERKKIMKNELDKFMEVMQGSTNAGNVFFSTFTRSAENKEYANWKIEPIDNKLKDGLFNSDSQESSNHILYALGIDPTIVGNGPGKTMAAGSGSDKREAFNIQIISLKPFQDSILAPLNVIRDVNGWDTDLEFQFKNYHLATLDNTNPESRI